MMATYVRRLIGKKVLVSIGVPSTRQNQDRVAALLKLTEVSKKLNVNKAQFNLSSSDCRILKKICEKDPENSCSKSGQDFSEDNVYEDESLVQEISCEQGHVSVRVCPKCLAKILLNSVKSDGSDFGKNSNLYRHRRTKDGLEDISVERVLFEYSSPNIAKPFHAGHLRSTIIGNVLSNLSQASGHMVTRLNYLGDWGTQFGLLCVGFERYGDREALKNNPMEHLFEVYVKVNSDVTKEIEGDDKTSTPTQKLGLDVFKMLENGDENYLKIWQEFRDLSVKEYKHIYKRLGVEFDEFHGESMYLKLTQKIVEQWREDKLLLFDSETGVGHIETDKHLGHSTKAKVLKSDGTSLYLTRDIAAILHRYDLYQFDKIHYIVDSSQVIHFRQMVAILEKMRVSWLPSVRDTLHVPFGRVDGMSTRQGKVVFLRDILDEAKLRMTETISNKETSKTVDDPEAVADTLGISAIIVQALKDRRQKSYTFSWDRVLNFKSDSGVFLQYAHARLCSLEENCGIRWENEFDPDCLLEPEAQRVVYHLIGFDTSIHEATQQLEPCLLVHYLFRLVHLTNVALYNLPVKGQSSDVAQARLWLFMCARQTLRNGFHVLGIPALEKM